MKVNFEYVQSYFGKAIILIVVAFLIWVMWPRGSKQIHKAVVSGLVMPQSSVAIDQRSSQVQIVEKRFEVGVGGAGGRVGEKDAFGLGVYFKYKF